MASTSRLELGWFVLLFAGSLAAAAQVSAEQALETVDKALESARSTAEMDSAWQAADRYRRTFGGQVDRVLRDSSLREAKVRACYLLGSFRDVGATDDLARNVDFEASGDDVAKWGLYPCAEALYSIGKAAEPALLLLLMDSESVTKREFALQVLVALRGNCGAAERMRNRLDGISEERSARLQKTLRELESGAFVSRADFPRAAAGTRVAVGHRADRDRTWAA